MKRFSKYLLVYVLLCAGAFIVLYPLIWMIFEAFKEEKYALSIAILPNHFTLESLKDFYTFSNF